MRIQTEQSWWSCDGLAFPEEERFERIAIAGFHGIHRRIPDADWCRRCAAAGLTWSATTILGKAAEIRDEVRRARDLGATWMNFQLIEQEPAEVLLDAIAEASQTSGLPLRVETHRGRITADRIRTIAFCRARPDLRLTLDLSHYVVTEMIDDDRDVFTPLFPAAGALHLRVSNGHQVQVPIAGHESHLQRFIRWWQATLVHARTRGDAWFPVVCELGPPPYAIRAPDGRELSDRWSEACALRQMVLQVAFTEEKHH